MYEVKPLPPRYEENIHDAVFNFFVYGLQPGSYTTFMLLHDFERAVHSAHPMLLTGPHDELSAHEVLVFMFKELPEFMVKENFHTWPGYVHQTDEVRQRIRDSYSEEQIREFQTYRTLDGREQDTFKIWVDIAEEKLEEMTA